jgi:predicted AlkP superfamily pyrophosphatase or phosphodiesterase
MPSRAYRKGGTVSRVSFSVMAAIFFVLSTSLAVGVADRLHRLSTVTSILKVQPKYLVVLVLDGARPDYLRVKGLTRLNALRSQGVLYDRAFAGILESETPSGHATISTGSTPAHDGLLGFNWVRGDNDAIRLFDPNVVRQGTMERLMQQAGASTIASLFKSRYPKAKVVAVSGHKYYAADPLGGPAADYILYYAPDAKNNYLPTAIPNHVPPASILSAPGLAYQGTNLPAGIEDTLAVKLALTSFRKVRQQVTLINLPEFDYPLGHVYGDDPAYVKTLMQHFDRDLGMIEDTYRKAGVLDQTLFVITSDHGMTPLRYIVPDSVLDDSITAAGTTSSETTYSTSGYVWLQNANMAKAVADNVVKKKDAHVQSVYYKVTSSAGDSYVRAGGLSISTQTDSANQYLLQSFLSGNAPDVVAICTEHTAFENISAKNWKGNHGGAAWESQHVPLLIAGPGVAGGTVSHAPARLEDVAPTALALFGIKARGMQGTVLADALRDPSSAQVRAQTQLDRTLSPVVAALSAQSQADTHT